MTTLHLETIGAGAPTLVLLHGIGGNGGVWRPLLRALGAWPGRILVPDLRGHGRSPRGAHYGLGQHAADVAALFAPGERVHLIGHSMGGAVALLLASGCFGITVERVFAFGTKVTWQEEEIAKALQLATQPARLFATRAEAEERFLRVSGLAGLPADLGAAIAAGVVAEDGRYRLAADPATMRAVGPPFAAVAGVAQAPFRLACGGRDTMVTLGELRRFDPAAIAFPECGHNAHVEAPDVVAAAALRYFGVAAA